MEQAQTPQAAPAPTATNAKSIWSIVAYLSWVGALVTAYKKRDAFHMWHARTSLGVSIAYFVVYAVVRVLIGVMPTAGFVTLVAMLVNLFGFLMFVFTIIAMLKAWKGEQWPFVGLAKRAQKLPLEKLFPVDGSSSAAVAAVEATVTAEATPAPAPVTPAAPEVTPQAPAVVEPVAEVATPAPAVEAATVVPEASVAPAPVADVPVVEPAPMPTPVSAPVEVEVQQEPEAPTADPGITIEPAVEAPVVAAPEAASVPEVPSAPAAPVAPQDENTTPPTV